MGRHPNFVTRMLDWVAARNVAPGQHLELFTTAASLSEDGTRWRIPLHAWVYTPQHSRVRLAALTGLLRARHGLEATEITRANLERRANLLFADNNRRVRVRVHVDGRLYELPLTSANGHARSMVEVPAVAIEAQARAGSIAIEAVLPAGDPRRLTGRCLLLPPEGVSVISDIDDTVKISHVLDRKRLFEQTFFNDFACIPGMAALFREWAAKGATLHFISSSPWHLHAPLVDMLAAHQFPPAPLTLKHIRLKDHTILDLFKDATAFKPPAIAAAMADHPRRRFVLVGDSGELDPEIYAGVARQNPGRIVQILIRDVTGATPGDDRFARAFAGLDPGLWQVFDEPAEIRWRPRPDA